MNDRVDQTMLHVAVHPERYVTIPLAAAVTGYTEKAIRHKIEDGVWREGKEWLRAPDGRIHVDLEGYRRWVARAPE